jgi:hypothetical protein
MREFSEGHAFAVKWLTSIHDGQYQLAAVFINPNRRTRINTRNIQARLGFAFRHQ